MADFLRFAREAIDIAREAGKKKRAHAFKLAEMGHQAGFERFERGQVGATRRLRMQQAGLTERLGITETGLGERLGVTQTGLKERRGMIEAGLEQRQTVTEGGLDKRLGITEAGKEKRLGITETGLDRRKLMGGGFTPSQLANLKVKAYASAQSQIDKMIDAGGMINPITGEELSPQEIAGQRDFLARNLLERYMGGVQGQPEGIIPKEKPLEIAQPLAPQEAMTPKDLQMITVEPKETYPSKTRLYQTPMETKRGKELAKEELIDLARKVGVGPENWKATGKLYKAIGKKIWGSWNKATNAMIDKMLSSQREARKGLPAYK